MDSIRLGSLKIFAKKGTKEKVVIFCSRADIGEIQKSLNKAHGGSWVWIEHLKTNEIIKFSDDTEYSGFHGRNERYSDAIVDINLF